MELHSIGATLADLDSYNRFYQKNKFSDYDRNTIEDGMNSMIITKTNCISNFNQKIWPRILSSKKEYEKKCAQLLNILKVRSNKIKNLLNDPVAAANKLFEAQTVYKENVEAVLNEIGRFTDGLEILTWNMLGERIPSNLRYF